MSLVLQCVDGSTVQGDVDSTCTAAEWVDISALAVSSPPLTSTEIADLWSAAALVLVLAWGFRVIRKVMMR